MLRCKLNISKNVLKLYNRVKEGRYSDFEAGFKTMVEDELFTDDMRSDVAEKFQWLENQNSIGLHANTGEPWYSPFHSNKENSHWNVYKNHLTKHKRWKKSHINSLDNFSTEIVSYLANPRGESRAVKGLVVGHIQSGKTANIMAVVAKAVDAGYKNIIVMTGRSELLRKQTQDRFNRELGIATLQDLKQSDSDHQNGDGWMRWTSYTHDFGVHHPDPEHNIRISIVKKNARRIPRVDATQRLGGVLGNLANQMAHGFFENQRQDSHRSTRPTLIIDD